jgi:hypothetical protein
VSQSDAVAARAALRGIATALPAPEPSTTLARAAPRSPMIGAWLATARRPGSSDGLAAIEAALWVVESGPVGAALLADAQALAELPVRCVVWGAAEGTVPEAWARLPRQSPPPLPITALEPEDSVARLYEGLAQSLLAGFGNSGGSHA